MHEVVFRAKRAHVRAYQLARSLGRGFGLTPARFDILFVVRAHGGRCRQSDVVRWLGLSRSTISLAVKQMAKLGLLRKEDGGEGRSAGITLTVDGLDRLVAAIEAFIRRDDLRDYLDALDPRGRDFVDDSIRLAAATAKHLGDTSDLTYPTAPPDAPTITAADAFNQGLRARLIDEEGALDVDGGYRGHNDDVDAGDDENVDDTDASDSPSWLPTGGGVHALSDEGPAASKPLDVQKVDHERLKEHERLGKPDGAVAIAGPHQHLEVDHAAPARVRTAEEGAYAGSTEQNGNVRMPAATARRRQSLEPSRALSRVRELLNAKHAASLPSPFELTARVNRLADRLGLSGADVGRANVRLMFERDGLDVPEAYRHVPSVMTDRELVAARRAMEARERAAAALPPNDMELAARVNRLAERLQLSGPDVGRANVRLMFELNAMEVPEHCRHIPSVLTPSELDAARRAADVREAAAASAAPSEMELAARIDRLAERLRLSGADVGRARARLVCELDGLDVPDHCMHIPSVLTPAELAAARAASRRDA